MELESLFGDDPDRTSFLFLVAPNPAEYQVSDEAMSPIARAVGDGPVPSQREYIAATDAINDCSLMRTYAGIMLGVAIESFRQLLVRREELLSAKRADWAAMQSE